MRKQKPKPEPVEVRRVVIRWPQFNAEASIVVAVKPDASSDESKAMASAMLRILIMQEALLRPLAQSENN